MTDLLLQAKDRLLAAELSYQEASDALNFAMNELETAKKIGLKLKKISIPKL